MISAVRSALALSLLGIGLSTYPARAEDWPQWRGPKGDDKSTETNLLQTWPEGGPQRVWLYENAGVGYGGPSIAGGQLFVLGTRDEQEVLIAMNAETGEELWTAPIGSIYENGWGDGARGTPTVAGDLVYALGGQGTLICARTTSGEVVWKKDFLELGGEVPQWGFCESPVVYKDLVLCSPGGEQGAIVGLDKATGEVRWQMKDVTSNAHYSSIVLYSHEGHDEAVKLQPDQLVGFDPATGKLLWSEPWPNPVAAIPTPIVHNEYVYVTCSYGVGCMLVKLGADHAVEVVYKNKTMKNKHGGVILLDDAIFGHSEGVGWMSQDLLTGDDKWRDRQVMEMGSVTYADGRFYCVGEETGDVVLVEPSAESWQERGRFKLEPQTTIRKDRGRIWTHPVVSNGRLYLRDQNIVYCYDVRESELAND